MEDHNIHNSMPFAESTFDPQLATLATLYCIEQIPSKGTTCCWPSLAMAVNIHAAPVLRSVRPCEPLVYHKSDAEVCSQEIVGGSNGLDTGILYSTLSNRCRISRGATPHSYLDCRLSGIVNDCHFADEGPRNVWLSHIPSHYPLIGESAESNHWTPCQVHCYLSVCIDYFRAVEFDAGDMQETIGTATCAYTVRCLLFTPFSLVAHCRGCNPYSSPLSSNGVFTVGGREFILPFEF